jgi:hypothetical protein
MQLFVRQNGGLTVSAAWGTDNISVWEIFGKVIASRSSSVSAPYRRTSIRSIIAHRPIALTIVWVTGAFPAGRR